MADMNTQKFLTYEGVSTLWTRIAEKVATDVKVEADRAKLAEQANATAAANAQSAADQANAKIGTMDNLSTTAKTDLVAAINEVRVAVDVGGVGSQVTLAKSDDGLTYTLKQGNNEVGTIDIPKDMVVESGSVVVDPEGQTAGTYIKLVLANVADPLFINVGTLVDLYTASENATQVQVSVDNTTRKISASIVAGSVNTTELADNAVTTAKIADANVTLAKLSNEVQTSLGKADSAVQSIVSGTTNGTIAVDGAEVAVAGLKSAAFAETTAFDAAGAAATAEQNAKNYADGLAGNYDAAGSAATAEQNAKNYADGLASNYDAAGSAAAAETAAKAYADAAAAGALTDAKAYANEVVGAEKDRAEQAESDLSDRVTTLEQIDHSAYALQDEVDEMFIAVAEAMMPVDVTINDTTSSLSSQEIAELVTNNRKIRAIYGGVPLTLLFASNELCIFNFTTYTPTVNGDTIMGGEIRVQGTAVEITKCDFRALTNAEIDAAIAAATV
jgi:hypothetical protein